MLQPSPADRQSDDVSPPSPLAYGLAYFLWFVALAITTLVALAVRDTIQLALVLTPWSRYAVHAVKQFTTLGLILVLVVVFIGLEAYFRNGVTKKEVLYRFWRTLWWLFAALAMVQLVRLLLEIAAGSVNLMSVLIFGAAATAALVSLGLVKRRVGTTLAAAGWILWGVAALGGALLLFLPIKFPLNIYDEGLALAGGLRVARGDVPLRDFWAIYPPGQIYLLGLIFTVTSPTVMVERVYDTFVRLALSLVLFAVTMRLLLRSYWALIPFACVVVMLAAATFYGYAVFPALLCAVLALLFHQRYADTGNRCLLWAAGLMVGLTTTFRLDLGVYAGAALAVGVAVAGLADDEEELTTGARTARTVRHLLIIAAGALLVIVPFYGYLMAVAGFDNVWTALLVFPATIFQDVRRLPYPAPWPDWSQWRIEGLWRLPLARTMGDWLRFYLPIAVLGLAAAALLVRALRCRRVGLRLPRGDATVASFVVLGAGLYIQALSRYDAIHVLPVSLIIVVLAAWLIHITGAVVPRRPYLAAALIPLLLIPLLLYLVDPVAVLDEHIDRFGAATCYSEIPAAGCVPSIPAQSEMLAQLSQVVAADEPVFVGLAEHDRIFVNDVSFYFLLDRPIPTRYHELHPGVATTAEVQGEIVRELEDAGVNRIVLVDWPNPLEPNGSAESSGVHLLDEYIRSTFVRTDTSGIYQLWERIRSD